VKNIFPRQARRILRKQTLFGGLIKSKNKIVYEGTSEYNKCIEFLKNFDESQKYLEQSKANICLVGVPRGGFQFKKKIFKSIYFSFKYQTKYYVNMLDKN